MDIEPHIDGKQVTLHIRGDITRPECDHLYAALVGLIEAGYLQLVLDFSDVPRIDSAGLGSLVRAWTFAHRQGGDLRIVNAGRASDLFSKTKLF